MADRPIARSTTHDGKAVLLWADGAVTSGLGYAFRGVPARGPRDEGKRQEALRVGWMVLGDASITDADEMGEWYAACRWAVRRGLLPGDARRRMMDQRKPCLRPSWEVTRTDARGNATERVWRLPRLIWPGLVVWDWMALGSTRGGRYEVWSADRSGTCTTTGMAFDNLDALGEYLATVRVERGAA